MTRLHTDGAEFGDTLFWDFYTGSGLSASTAQKRSGAYSYLFNNTVNHYAYKNLSSASDELYIRVAIRPSTVFSHPSTFISWWKGATELGSIRLGNSPRLFYAYTSTGTLAATGSINTSLDTWYLLEIRIKIADSGGRIVLKVDGITDIDFTGDTKPGSDTTIDRIRIKPTTENNLNFGTCYFDDLAINDVSGGVDDSWCGDGHIIRLAPNADGDSSQFVGSDGNSTNNYLLVDEVPASASDYVEASVSGDLDLYNLAASGLSDVDILRVWAEARAADTVAAGGQIYLPIKTGGNQFDGTAVTLATTYTLQLLGDVYAENPDTTNPWTVSDIDALQVGSKVV